MTRKPILLLWLVTTLISSAHAEPRLKSGKWKITTTVENAMMPSGGNQVVEQCIRSSDFDFKKLIQGLPKSDCEPVKPKTSGRTVTWQLSCTNPITPTEKITGHGQFTGNHESAEGMMQISMTIPGMEKQTFITRWQYEYLGKCD